MKRSRSAATVLLVAVLLAALGATVTVGLQPPAGAQGSVVTGYTPCEVGQDVDLLIMMDASGSLNAPAGGIDPNGTQRRGALRRFRDNLTSLLSELPERDADTCRLLLCFTDGVYDPTGEPTHAQADHRPQPALYDSHAEAADASASDAPPLM